MNGGTYVNERILPYMSTDELLELFYNVCLDAGEMKLLKTPVTPKELIVSKENKFRHNVPDEWKVYLGG